MKLICWKCAARVSCSAARNRAPLSRGAIRGRQFACLVWNNSVERDVEGASALLSSLIGSGCRYIVCAGHDCEWWHDLADELFVAKYLDAPEEERERNHVMTTWHVQELPDNVAFFLAFNTRFSDISFDSWSCIWATGPTSTQWTALSRPKLVRSPASGTLVEQPPFHFHPKRKANISLASWVLAHPGRRI